MPAPDPEGLHLEEYDGGGFSITCEIWEHGNRRNRMARMRAVARDLRFGKWCCWWCGEPVPLYRRADARYCRERCRKAAARKRRARW